ncbi:hypothetical protein, partial [Bacillus cereus]|uniref:hypothetical protein n=1 Tax=Bacillus cereus TaxID=1396 RepID=UPI00196B4AFF
EHQLGTDRFHSWMGHLFNLKKKDFLTTLPSSKTKTAFLSFPIQGLNTPFEHQSGTDRSHPWMGHLFNLKKKGFLTILPSSKTKTAFLSFPI